MTERRERGWLPEGSGNPPRRGVLEDTLFRRLEEMRKKPPGELFELLERTLDVLRATKEALLEQRREIRSLATAVDTLRSRVDQLVQHRPEPEAAYEPAVAEEPALETEFEREPTVDAELEAALEPVPEPEPAAEPEPEPEPALPPAAVWTDYGRRDPAPEFEGPAAGAAEHGAGDDGAGDDGAVEEPAPAIAESENPERNSARVEETSTHQTVEHVLMLSTAAGYRIVIGSGAEPTPTVEVDGVVFQVSGRMSSPFPGDTRTAFFATRSESAVAPHSAI